jgi:AcrR family transcriptional regulator
MAGNNWYWRQESPYGTIGRTGQSVTLRARDPRMQTKPANGINEDRCARRREEILAVAARLFAERGFSNTDTQDIADQLQVGKGTLYRYFPTKRELFLAAADRVMREMRQRVDASIAGVADPLERLSQGIRAFLSFYTEHPQYVELLIQERAQFKDREKPTFLEHRDANVARWREFYRKLIGEGRVRDIPVAVDRSKIRCTTSSTSSFTASSANPNASAAMARKPLSGGDRFPCRASASSLWA